MRTRFVILLSALLLSGAGCAPRERLENALAKVPWFGAPSNAASEASRSIALESGLAFTVRPSTLGVTGAFDGVIGDESRALRVTVREAAPETFLATTWESASATGTLALALYGDAEAMLLPAFWPVGEGEARQNGGLWMTRAAFETLQNEGGVEWRLGLAEQTLSVVSRAFQTFNTLAITYAGSATTSGAASPFHLKKTGTSDTFPLLVDGRLTLVRVVRASSWFADLFILDHPENPLILKVVVHTAAQPALKALEPTPVHWNELGYEITSISRP
ncbi:MAG: hypothetical protein QY323_01715 [Patescibacteria group bacterium]|nr:MAG: hypothetical protein QY323_01715 [Patescibacteria group bacterium]